LVGHDARVIVGLIKNSIPKINVGKRHLGGNGIT